MLRNNFCILSAVLSRPSACLSARVATRVRLLFFFFPPCFFSFLCRPASPAEGHNSAFDTGRGAAAQGAAKGTVPKFFGATVQNGSMLACLLSHASPPWLSPRPRCDLTHRKAVSLRASLIYGHNFLCIAKMDLSGHTHTHTARGRVCAFLLCIHTQ